MSIGVETHVSAGYVDPVVRARKHKSCTSAGITPLRDAFRARRDKLVNRCIGPSLNENEYHYG
jgi:hypothetical protein